MTFYLKPPRGIIEYNVLQKCVEERIKFFKSIVDPSFTISNTEYLFEDSALDRAGHYTLRLAATQDFTFLSYFINAEMNLLKLRLASYNTVLFHKFFKKLLRHTNECINELKANGTLVDFLNVLMNVIMKMCSRSYRTHVLHPHHCFDEKCKLFVLNVPFQHCISLVAAREVPVKNGYISISCDKWQDLIMSLYHNFLQISLRQMKSSQNVHAALNDHRIKTILASIRTTYSFTTDFSLEVFPVELKNFPLCMQNLQQILSKSHRLSHEARFNYSLFLKDIGMSFEDSVMFWKNEYSKDSSCGKCSHSWHRDEKRYVYSIQHLYGLVGSRKSYKTRSCEYFQRSLINPTEEAVCPFKHFDEQNLSELVSSCFNLSTNDEYLKKILVERLKSPSTACSILMNFKHFNNNTIADNADKSFNNPVHCYYLKKSK